jgi:hypothetical protein
MTFGELVEGLGAKLGVEIEDAGGAVAFEIDGETVVLHLADEDLVLVRADLGEIPPDRRDALAPAALEANFLYKGTGGATLAVNPVDTHLHLQKYNWLGRLDVDKALDMLSRFAETAVAWKRIASDAAAAAPEAPPQADFQYGGFIQV